MGQFSVIISASPGSILGATQQPAARLPVLGQVKEKPASDPAAQGDPAPVPALPEGQGQ